jgi:hypothetical protein
LAIATSKVIFIDYPANLKSQSLLAASVTLPELRVIPTKPKIEDVGLLLRGDCIGAGLCEEPQS